MLTSAREVHHYRILATDGAIGSLEDLYFDDEAWKVRYLVVDTGNWLSGRSVLLSPSSIEKRDAKAEALVVRLTRKQVEDSPDIDTNKPVSRQQETELSEYYGWPAYWPGGDFPPPPSERIQEDRRAITAERDGPNLRSAEEVMGYEIQSQDGAMGVVHDFLIDQDWVIRYLVVDTRRFLPGRKVLIANTWVDRIMWAERAVSLGLTSEEVKRSPELSGEQPIGRDYEEQLHRHYQRPGYWEK